jgi:holin-like protein
MLGAVLALIGCQLLGEILRGALHLPIPGPVIGMALLAVALAFRDRKAPADVPADSALDQTSGVLLQHMGLLFVPAGVGIIAQMGLLRQEWMPILVSLLGSTILSLMVTGFIMHRLGRAPARPQSRIADRTQVVSCIAK